MSTIARWLGTALLGLAAGLVPIGFATLVEAQAPSSMQQFLDGYDVRDFGAAVNKPSVDSSIPFQAALDAASKAGGGTVLVPHGRFWFRRGIRLGTGVVLKGRTPGPYDAVRGTYPNEASAAPTLLPQDTSQTPFIIVQGSGGGIEDLLVYYPDQIKRNQAVPPRVYPPTIRVLQPSHVRRVTLANSYQGIEILSGRVDVDDSLLGSYRWDVLVDNAADIVRIRHTTISIFSGYQFPFGQPLDWWTLDNGIGIISRRCDQLSLQDLLIFGRNTAIKFEDPHLPELATNGFGDGINIDTVRNGIIAEATNRKVGFTLSNVHFGPVWVGAGYAVWTKAGAIETPRVLINGGSIRLIWAEEFKQDPGTTLVVNDVFRYNDPARP